MNQYLRLTVFMLIFISICNIFSYTPYAEESDSNIEMIYVTYEDMINGNFEKLLTNNTCSATTLIRYPIENGDDEEIIFYAYYTNLINTIFTPNGTDVNGGIGAEVYNIVCDIPDEVIEDIENRINTIYGGTPCFIQYPFITYHFNCHSYAWHSRIFKSSIWINNPALYFSEADQSYREINVDEEELRLGDIVCYYADGKNEHSGIIVGFTEEEPDESIFGLNTLIVNSKWHMASLCQHRGDVSPYTEQTDEVKYFRLNTHSSHNISSISQNYRIEHSINSNSTDIFETYGMFEINIADAGIYNISFDTSYQVSGYILDIDRNNVATINSNNHYIELDEGIYYLRIEFTGDNVGDIDISISNHEHIYDNYVLFNETCSKPTCYCGDQLSSSIQHSYTYGYALINDTYHAPTCSCGFKLTTQLTRHTLDTSYVDPIDSTNYGKCKFCEGRFKKSSGIFPIIKKIPDEISYTE